MRHGSTRTLPAMRQGDCDARGCFSNSPRPRRVRTLHRYQQHSVSAVGGACERGASALASTLKKAYSLCDGQPASRRARPGHGWYLAGVRGLGRALFRSGARSGKTASAGARHLLCRCHGAMRQAAWRGRRDAQRPVASRRSTPRRIPAKTDRTSSWRVDRVAQPFGFRAHGSERAAFPHSAPPEGYPTRAKFFNFVFIKESSPAEPVNKNETVGS